VVTLVDITAVRAAFAASDTGEMLSEPTFNRDGTHGFIGVTTVTSAQTQAIKAAAPSVEFYATWLPSGSWQN
jgi:hypothetical protein